ncbi:MAG: nucleotide exchange factor GrpE [Flavobacteriales bacterium]|nr:nucleotide exchange factor GrpE [Flavobacteriales bacterium]
MAFKNPFSSTNKEKPAMEQEEMKNEQGGTVNETSPLEEQNETATDTEAVPELTETERLSLDLESKQAEIAALNDKNLRLFAEFDNFRKRTAKEKLEMLQTAGVDTLKNMLPVMDDMERAITNNATVEDVEAVKQGLKLIHQKFSKMLNDQGVKAMHAKGEPFDPEIHEAITKAPAPTADLKGKVLDVIESGYLMNDKVIRYAKVVVGE